MRDYKKYDVWIKSHELVLLTYNHILICFPATEQYDLLSQLKRAAYPIPLNIAEGCGRKNRQRFCSFS